MAGYWVALESGGHVRVASDAGGKCGELAVWNGCVRDGGVTMAEGGMTMAEELDACGVGLRDWMTEGLDG